MDIHACLEEAVKRKASDFHIVVGIQPTLRVNGKLIFINDKPVSSQVSKTAIYGILTPEQTISFEKNWELNFAYAIQGLGRFRVNVYVSRGNVEAAFRVISMRPRSMHELGLPAIVGELSFRSGGLVLITGAAGQGKTTTLASMIDHINREGEKCRIVTIEDPIEYMHTNVNSVIIQREVGIDTQSFNSALVQSLRQDPNVICIGEIRDLETITTALTAAETGHLVLATLHTPDAPQCVDRIVDVFPSHQQQQIRFQLASSLQGVLSQKLLPRKDINGSVVAVEALIGTPAVRNLIRDNKTEQLYGVMQTSGGQGMILMDDSLKVLYEKGLISLEVAVSRSRDPRNIKEQD